MNGEQGAAGKPPYVRFETITPTGEHSELDTGVHSVLDTGVHHLPTYNDGIRLIAEDLPPLPQVPRTGRGSANHRPPSRIYHSHRLRRRRTVGVTVLWAAVLLLLATASALILQAFLDRDNAALVAVRAFAPVWAVAGMACVVAAVALFGLLRDGGRR